MKNLPKSRTTSPETSKEYHQNRKQDLNYQNYQKRKPKLRLRLNHQSPKKPKPDSSTKRKTKKSEDGKTKKAEQTREKAGGYWLKLTENQKTRKNMQQEPEKVKNLAPAPELQVKQQTYCNSSSRTTRLIDRNSDVLEVSSKLESKTKIMSESEITLGNQIKLG